MSSRSDLYESSIPDKHHDLINEITIIEKEIRLLEFSHSQRQALFDTMWGNESDK